MVRGVAHAGGSTHRRPAMAVLWQAVHERAHRPRFLAGLTGKLMVRAQVVHWAWPCLAMTLPGVKTLLRWRLHLQLRRLLLLLLMPLRLCGASGSTILHVRRLHVGWLRGVDWPLLLQLLLGWPAHGHNHPGGHGIHLLLRRLLVWVLQRWLCSMRWRQLRSTQRPRITRHLVHRAASGRLRQARWRCDAPRCWPLRQGALAVIVHGSWDWLLLLWLQLLSRLHSWSGLKPGRIPTRCGTVV